MKLICPKCKEEIGMQELTPVPKLLALSDKVPWDALFYTDLDTEEVEALEEFVATLKELKNR